MFSPTFIKRCVILVLPLFLLVACSRSTREDSVRGQAIAISAVEGTTPAPDFPAGMEWINTRQPLTLEQLRGKIVLLDFWTYACINCMHIIPDLKKLEEKYKKELVVIGVHSAKFRSERDTRNILQAMERYGITHPVLNDQNMIFWDRYGINAWPTLVLIDPMGRIVGMHSGEGIAATFDPLIPKVIEQFDDKGLINREPVANLLQERKVAEGFLRFPGKILADESSRRLFIADSNHHRLVVTDLEGKVLMTLGNGTPGFEDGDSDEAQFRNPQGMALKEQTLYVADMDNHAIREVDLTDGSVETVAGTGSQAEKLSSEGKARKVDLNSPWDLTIHGNHLYIAMAGFHQIWRMNLETHHVEPFAGSGYENITDGPLHEAALAQPTGIISTGKRLYFVDSESSSVRTVDLEAYGDVRTLAGTGGLFEYGDQDGAARKARFQHPVGITYHEGVLYVADTLNNKIKKVFPQTREVATFLGNGKEGFKDGRQAQFNEPAGLSVADGKLYIADTNNHVIRVADLKTRQVTTLQVEERKKEEPLESAALRKVKPGRGNVELKLTLPAGHKLNAQAPSRVTISSSSPAIRFHQGKNEATLTKPLFPVRIPIMAEAGTATLKVEWVLYYCPEKEQSLCYFKEATTAVPVTVEEGVSPGSVEISYEVPVQK